LPPTAKELADKSDGRLFLNFDDLAWGPAIEGFLRERFGESSKFENVSAAA
jgi:hypothetical protein